MQITDLAEHKRELLIRSEQYRQSLRTEMAAVAEGLAWVPRAANTLRFASPLLLLFAPVAAFAAGRWGLGRSAAPTGRSRGGFFGKLIAAVRIFQQVKPVWDGFRKVRSF